MVISVPAMLNDSLVDADHQSISSRWQVRPEASCIVLGLSVNL